MAQRRGIPRQCGTAAGRRLPVLPANGHHLGNRHGIRPGHVVRILRHINDISETLYLKGASNFTVTQNVTFWLFLD